MITIFKNVQQYIYAYQFKQKESYILEADISNLKNEIHIHEKSLHWLMESRTELLKDVIKELNEMCTLGLKSVFSDDYSFEIEITESARPQCKFWVIKDNQKFDPNFELGGGVLDIISLCIRIALWSLKRTSPLFILDEPLKFLSKDKQYLARDLIYSLVEKLKIQLIIVTHVSELTEDVENENTIIYKLSKDPQTPEEAIHPS